MGEWQSGYNRMNLKREEGKRRGWEEGNEILHANLDDCTGIASTSVPQTTT